MSSLEIGTGIIYHLSSTSDTTISHQIKSSKDTPNKIFKLCFGYDHMVLLKSNSFIQKISNSTIFNESFLFLEQFNSNFIIDISFGKHHGIALTNNNKVYSFGDNTYGQLGIGYIGNKENNNNIIHKPQLIQYFDRVQKEIIQIKCGENHCCALTKSGDIYTWGNGVYGQLGANILSIQILPRYVASIPNKKEYIKQIECGPQSTFAITNTNKLYMFGSKQVAPQQITFDEPDITIKKISCGLGHYLCLTECGKLYGFGLSCYGQLGIDGIPFTKTIKQPILLKSQCIDNNINNIECCGLYSVICKNNNEDIYILGYNDMLFNKKQNINPYKLNLTKEPVYHIGCSRYDFVVIASSSISSITPSVCNINNGTKINIYGSGFYQTPFQLKIKYIFDDNKYIVENTNVKFVEINENNNNYLSLTAQTPNLKDLNQNNIVIKEYPYKMKVCVSFDGEYYSESSNIYILNPSMSDSFELNPKCGDISGNIKCILKNKSNYFTKLLSINDLKLNNVKIKLTKNKSENINYIISAYFNNNNDLEFTIPSIDVGEYNVLIAYDGQQFISTNNIFTSYNIECIKCIPDIVNLSNNDNKEIEFEIEVKGFVQQNPNDIKLRFIGDSEAINEEIQKEKENIENNQQNDIKNKQNVQNIGKDENDDNQNKSENISNSKLCFISECIYESLSARNIIKNENKIKEKYKNKRIEIENNKKLEINKLEETRKIENEEREKWLKQIEKDKKKKKKQNEIEAFELEIATINDEWNQKLKNQENENHQINRKYRKKLHLINFEENKIIQEIENDNINDNGNGFIKFKVNISELNKYIQPNNIQIQISLNNILFSNLCFIKSINPVISNIIPPIGLYSENTKIEIFINGFNMQNIEKKEDLKIQIINDEEIIEIEKKEFEINNEFNKIILNIPILSKSGKKKIEINYKNLINISCMFIAYDTISIGNITPKIYIIDTGDNNDDKNRNKMMKISITNLNEENIDFFNKCNIKIKGNDDKSINLFGRLNDNKKDIEVDFNYETLKNIGIIKKAQVELTFNNQQWIKAKQTIEIK